MKNIRTLVYTASLFLILAVGFSIRCGQKEKEPSQVPQQSVIHTIITLPDGSKIWAWSVRTNYIKEVKGNKVVWDTLWEYPKYEGKKDSAGNAIPTMTRISKDSVKWKGIEGVPLDSLLKKSNPPR